MFMIFVGRHASPEYEEEEGVLEVAAVSLGIDRDREKNKGSGQCGTNGQLLCHGHFAVTFRLCNINSSALQTLSSTCQKRQLILVSSLHSPPRRRSTADIN